MALAFTIQAPVGAPALSTSSASRCRGVPSTRPEGAERLSRAGSIAAGAGVVAGAVAARLGGRQRQQKPVIVCAKPRDSTVANAATLDGISPIAGLPLEISAHGEEASLTVRLLNSMDVPLLLDGIWVKQGSASGIVCHEGLAAQGVGELSFHGPEVAAVFWLRASEWPYVVVTLAVQRNEDDIRVAGEMSRVPLADARTLLDGSVSVVAPTGHMVGGLQWHHQQARGGSCLTVRLPRGPDSTALVPLGQGGGEEERWPSLSLPSFGEVAGWVLKAGEQVPRGLRDQLEERHGGVAQPVADRYFFEILGLEPGASPRGIRAAWRRRAQEVHPDLVGEDRERFDEIREAFQVLSDPTLRARYEALGASGLEQGQVRAHETLEGFATALELLLGTWALRPLVGGPLTPPLGLGQSGAEGAAAAEEQAEVAASSDIMEQFRMASSLQLRVLLGLPEAHEVAAEAAAELRAALATSERVAQLVVGRDPRGFEESLRGEVRTILQAAKGTLASHLLARWGAGHRAGVWAWLHREAPSPGYPAATKSAGPGQASFLSRVARTAGITGSLVAGLVAMPAAVFATLLVPPAANATVEAAITRLIDVAYQTALLEVENRGAYAAQRLLEDATQPWQLRWRAAQALLRFGEILEEEGDPSEPDLVKFVQSEGQSES